MKITVAGSLGNVGKPLTEKLVSAGHEVTVISSNSSRKEAIEALGAKAAIGSVSDASFLKNAFEGADAVFAMTPPNMGPQNLIQNTIDAGKAYFEAIKNSGVKRIVMLSSVGADLPSGTGPIAGLHVIENLYSQLENVSVTFLRAGYFYTNFYNNVPLIKGMNIMGGNFPGTATLPLVHPDDIAAAAAEELQKNTTGKTVRYIASDVRKLDEVAAAIGSAIGKQNLNWVSFTDEQSKAGMKQAGLPEEIAGLYTEMGAAIREGKVQADFNNTGARAEGKTKLEDFAKEFAAAF